MIGFSIMMWFSSALLIFFSISLLKGNYSSVHGKVFETTNDKNGYAKAFCSNSFLGTRKEIITFPVSNRQICALNSIPLYSNSTSVK